MESTTNKSVLLVLFAFFALFSSAVAAPPSLSTTYYATSCANVKNIVRKAFLDHFKVNNALSGPILRLFFHDSFTNGVDGSVLINNTGSNQVEKDIGPNASLRGFYIIDYIKAAVEKECPGVVSCSDILTLATKSAIKEAGGPDINFKLGRLDGLTSSFALATLFNPRASASAADLKLNFTNVGLNSIDLVALSGGHTLGVSHCSPFRTRINGTIDPNLDPAFAQTLIASCLITNPTTNTVSLNTTALIPFDSSFTTFDNRYFKDLLENRVLLRSDSALLTDPTLASIVNLFAADKHLFIQQFESSMIKLSEVNLVNTGEVRKKCHAYN